MKRIKLYSLIGLLTVLESCSNYLDIVPDDVATIESAFTLRVTAERFLFTCYSGLPYVMNRQYDPAFGLWGGEMFTSIRGNPTHLYGVGNQSVVNPRLNFWDGLNGAGVVSLFQSIRNCNIFLENVLLVPDITEEERSRWIGEATFLKAYYHFYLVRCYGPIPLMRENLPIGSSIDNVRVFRDPVDDCFDYIVELLDEAIPDLPQTIINTEQELGRITQPIAAAIKAKVLVTAASPFFNGNSAYADFVDKRGTVLFNQVYEPEKWERAADACREAITICHDAGLSLYKFTVPAGSSAYVLSDTTMYQMSIRNSVCLKWNQETIWADPNQDGDQRQLLPRSWDPVNQNQNQQGRYGASIEYTELFYSDNGVPIEDDVTYDYDGRFELKTAGFAERYNMRQGHILPKMHFDRENRFYATFGFDGGVWYGQGKYNDNDPYVIRGKFGEHTGYRSTNFMATGYWPKKTIHYQNIILTGTVTQVWYPLPVMRLADLYLLYAEAQNEYVGPDPEVYEYLNRVRERAGLPGVQEAWTNYSRNPTQYQSKEGLREIIRRERQIELTCEGQRFWDVKRWNIAQVEFSKQVSGWNVMEGATTETYYQKLLVYEPEFAPRFYLDPIREQNVLQNPNLAQNPGW